MFQQIPISTPPAPLAPLPHTRQGSCRRGISRFHARFPRHRFAEANDTVAPSAIPGILDDIQQRNSRFPYARASLTQRVRGGRRRTFSNSVCLSRSLARSSARPRSLLQPTLVLEKLSQVAQTGPKLRNKRYFRAYVIRVHQYSLDASRSPVIGMQFRRGVVRFRPLDGKNKKKRKQLLFASRPIAIARREVGEVLSRFGEISNRGREVVNEKVLPRRRTSLSQKITVDDVRPTTTTRE